MGLLNRAQEIHGLKTFLDGIIVKGDVKFNRTITAYSPVASEPSLGTLHMLATISADVGGTATPFTDIDVSAIVPVGTKAVLLEARPIAVSNVTTTCACQVQFRKNGSAGTVGNPQVGSSVNPAINGTTYAMYGMAIVEVDSSRIFEYKNNGTGTSSRSAEVYVVGYWC